ncbi:MAG: hypothetical protein WCZ65_13155 [Lysobacteraceae bacterium]|jgi:hypothetical protein
MSLLPLALFGCLLAGPVGGQSASAAEPSPACEDKLREQAWRHLGEAIAISLRERGAAVAQVEVNHVESIELLADAARLSLWALARDGEGRLALLQVDARMARDSLRIIELDYFAHGGDGQVSDLLAAASPSTPVHPPQGDTP